MATATTETIETTGTDFETDLIELTDDEKASLKAKISRCMVCGKDLDFARPGFSVACSNCQGKNEIATLKKLQAGWRYVRFETLSKKLDEAEFPYQLVQGYDKKTGCNVYHWNGEYGKGSIYVTETDAHKVKVKGVRNACLALEKEIAKFIY